MVRRHAASLKESIEPCQLKGSGARTRLRTEIETHEPVTEIMGPRADPRFNWHAAAREQRECVQIARDVRVEPATHRANRNVYIAERPPDAEPVPKVVVGRMLERNTPHIELESGGCDIRIHQWQVIDVARKRKARRFEWSEIFVQPYQPMPQLQSAAWRVKAVEIFIVSGNHGKYRDKPRIPLNGSPPLDDAQVGTARHSDTAIGPRLASNPIDGVIAIRPFLRNRTEATRGTIAPAHVLNNHGIAAQCKHPIATSSQRPAIVGSANQNSRPGATAVRKEDVGHQLDPVAHRRRNIVMLNRGVWQLARRRACSKNESKSRHEWNCPKPPNPKWEHLCHWPAGAGLGRAPNRAVPTRTMVAPSSIATSKSFDIPIDSSGREYR